eukprot:s2201_g10.t4
MLPGGYMVIYPNRRVVVLQHAGPPLAVTQSRLARSQQPILPPTTAMGSEVQVPPAVRGPGSGATAPPGPTVSFVPFERRAPPEAGDDLFASPEASRFKLDPAAEMTARNWSPGHSQPDVARFDLDVTQRDWVRPGSSPRRTWNRPPVDEPSMVFPRWWTKRHSEEAFDSEWELLQSWFTQHHAGEGPCLYRMYQEALSAAPPKGRCHDHGWHAVAEYRLRQIEWVAGHMGLHPSGPRTAQLRKAPTLFDPTSPHAASSGQCSQPSWRCRSASPGPAMADAPVADTMDAEYFEEEERSLVFQLSLAHVCRCSYDALSPQVQSDQDSASEPTVVSEKTLAPPEDSASEPTVVRRPVSEKTLAPPEDSASEPTVVRSPVSERMPTPPEGTLTPPEAAAPLGPVNAAWNQCLPGCCPIALRKEMLRKLLAR